MHGHGASRIYGGEAFIDYLVLFRINLGFVLFDLLLLEHFVVFCNNFGQFCFLFVRLDFRCPSCGHLFVISLRPELVSDAFGVVVHRKRLRAFLPRSC